MKFTLLGTARINLLFLIKTDLHLVLPLVIASALGIFNFFFLTKTMARGIYWHYLSHPYMINSSR